MGDDIGRKVTVVWDSKIDWHGQPSKRPYVKPFPHAETSGRPAHDTSSPRIQATRWATEVDARLIGNSQTDDERRDRRRALMVVGIIVVIALVGGGQNAWIAGGVVLAVVAGLVLVALAMVAIRALTVWFLRPIVGLFKE